MKESLLDVNYSVTIYDSSDKVNRFRNDPTVYSRSKQTIVTMDSKQTTSSRSEQIISNKSKQFSFSPL